MHFLKEIVKTPILEDPPKKHVRVHRHFYRYSKGEFIGPALKISKTNTRITLKGSHEYEDLIIEIVSNTIPENEVEIKGTLITGTDISDIITDLGFKWDLKKSTGKTKNYKANISTVIDKKILLQSIEIFRKNTYFLISFNINPTCKVSTKKTIPQPSKKKIEDDDINKRITFCSGVIENNEYNRELVISSAFPDFKKDISSKWNNILITNNYKISDIILPDDVKDWGLKRIMAIRKGKLFRTVEIDGEIIEKQYSIVV